MKAIIFAAGLGTRLAPETFDKPKALVEVGGKPLLLHALEKLYREGIHDVVVNVHHFPDLIIDFLKTIKLDLNIKISDEREKLLDTGGALKKAAPLLESVSDPVLMYNVDVLSNVSLQLLEKEHLASGALATLVVRKRETQRYFKFDSDKRLVGWINHKNGEEKIIDPDLYSKGTELAFSGIHVVHPAILNFMPPEDRFSIVDLYLQLGRNHLINGFFDTSSFWLDVGKPDSLEKARKIFG